jgi:hypothetical protein
MLPPTLASKPTLAPVVPLLFTRKIASAVSTVVELTTVCVPCTVKLPVMIASPETVTCEDVMSSLVNVPVTVKFAMLAPSTIPISTLLSVIVVSI